VELRHLHYFLKIAETGSFTQAAAALRVTQPTLSHQIRQLEQEIGSPLFDRMGRSIRITQAGRVLRDHAERALRELESGLASVTALDEMAHGSLRIGVFRSFGNSPLPGVLADFHNAYPGIHASVLEMSLSDMEEGLISGSIDLAITTYLPATSSKLTSETLFKEPLVLAVGARHEWYGRTSIPLEKLESVKLVLRPAGAPSRRLIEQCFAARKLKPTVVMEMNSSEAALATVRSSGLATICAKRALADATGLSAIRIEAPELRRHGAILWHRHRHRPRAAAIFADMAKQAYAINRAEHAGCVRGKPR
jgi:LysR family cyn operon transcriptional activator